jgi:hypothetical protein
MFTVSPSLKNKIRSVITAAAAAGFLVMAAPPGAVALAGPFTALAGSWSGGGTVTMSSGTRERIRCRATYDVDKAGINLNLTLRCASDSYNFELQSSVAHSGGTVSGTWAELTRRVGGSVEGSVRGNRIQVRVSGVLSAMLAVSTNANRQSISIDAPGSEMSAVAISLSRRK